MGSCSLEPQPSKLNSSIDSTSIRDNSHVLCGNRYDNHRDQILQAGRHQAGADNGHGTQQAPPEDLSLFQYFSSSCYNGYHDEAAVRPVHLLHPTTALTAVFPHVERKINAEHAYLCRDFLGCMARSSGTWEPKKHLL